MIVAEIRQRLMRVLAWLWKAAWKAGAEASGVTLDKKAMKAALEAFLATVGENWALLIAATGEAGLLQAIKDALAAGDPEAVAGLLREILNVDVRSDMIAITEVMRAWNAAAFLAMKAAGVAFARWQTTSGHPCPTCVANQKASPLPLGALYPGGVAHPLQHVRCMCVLVPAEPPKTPPVGATKVLRRQVDTNGQEFWGDAPPLEANAAGGGATGPYPHRADGAPQEDIPGGVPGATAGGEPPRRDFSSVQPHVLSLPSGDDGEWGEAAGTGSVPQKDFPAPYMDSYWPGGGHGSQQAPTSSPGGANGRPPNPVGKAMGPRKLLTGAPSVPAKRVRQQLLGNYPPKSLTWVKDARWVHVKVPHALIDYAGEATWAAAHQQGHDEHFAQQIAAGEHVDPAVMVWEPGESRIRVMDGHHRTLGSRDAGVPVDAYVGILLGR